MRKISVIVALLVSFSAALGSRSLTERELRGLIQASALTELPTRAKVHVGQISVRGAALSSIAKNASVSLLSPHPPLGLVNFEISWWEKESERKAFGTTVIKASLPIAVAKAPISHGEPFTLENVGFEERELGQFANTGYYSDWEKLRELRANGVVRPGTVIGISNAQRAYAVKLGQLVECHSDRGPLSCRRQGEGPAERRADGLDPCREHRFPKNSPGEDHGSRRG